MDVLKNATNPYFGSTKIAMGNAEIVAAEVLVSKLLRKILGMAPRVSLIWQRSTRPRSLSSGVSRPRSRSPSDSVQARILGRRLV